MKHPKYYDSQKDATARYNKKAYDRINVIVKKGQREVIKAFAASQGKSLNRFICDAIAFQMNQAEADKE
ncbi:MAG: antitoxin [Oscillospiraceae bacterium]|nr:antitoxin [Oscillospiraceae bacterium]